MTLFKLAEYNIFLYWIIQHKETMKKILLLIIIPILNFAQIDPAELCDSISISFIEYNEQENYIEIQFSTEFITEYSYGYAGFTLTNGQGEIIATETIMIKEFDKYLGKLVANKCGQIFSTGKKAIQTTVAIGKRTSVEIKTANMPHLSQLN